MGDWREIGPSAVISLKRRLDREVKGYALLLGEETERAYDALMSISFEVERGRDQTLLIRANRDMYRTSSTWNDGDENLFVDPSKRCRRAEFNRAHDRFMQALFRTIGLRAQLGTEATSATS